jgi:hypothetical protein
MRRPVAGGMRYAPRLSTRSKAQEIKETGLLIPSVSDTHRATTVAVMQRKGQPMSHPYGSQAGVKEVGACQVVLPLVVIHLRRIRL